MAVMANQACMVFDFFFLFIAWHFETPIALREREKHFGTFSVYVRLMVLELASLEKKKKERKKERKKMTIFDFFRIRFLSFCTAELKSEDIFVLRRVRAFSGYSFCWLNPQSTCLFTLAYCTVKTFQPPSSLHRDCYVIILCCLFFFSSFMLTLHAIYTPACKFEL